MKHVEMFKINKNGLYLILTLTLLKENGGLFTARHDGTLTPLDVGESSAGDPNSYMHHL